MLQAGRVQLRRPYRIDRDEELAGAGLGREAGGGVDHVTQRREVAHRPLRAGRADERRTGVHRSANRDRPAAGRVGLPDPGEQRPGCPDRRRRVTGSRDSAEEQADRLVADELVDDPVAAQDRPRRQPVEAVEERPELGRAQALADAGGASDVGEQQAHRDLRAVDADLVEIPDAVAADRRVAREPAEPDVSQHGAARSLERCGAQLAVRSVGQMSHHGPEARQARVLTGEEAPHRVLGVRWAWHRCHILRSPGARWERAPISGPCPRRCSCCRRAVGRSSRSLRRGARRSRRNHR